MLPMGHRRNRTATRQKNSSTPLPPPDLTEKSSSVEQLSFPDIATPPDEDTQSFSFIAQFSFPPVSRDSAPGQSSLITSPSLIDLLTLNLPVVLQERQTEALAPDTFVAELENSANTARKRVVIHGSGQKNLSLRPPKVTGRRIVVSLAVSVLLAFSILATLIAVAPIGEQENALEPFKSVLSIMGSKNNNIASISSVVATATAVTMDGYDPGGNQQFAGVAASDSTISINGAYMGPASSIGSVSAADAGNLNRFQDGQCTYWANMHYHALTQHWIPWLGNANAWAYQAEAYGWAVSNTPNANGPSIIVLQSGVQNAGYYGHVAVVESINADGSVQTSNWNWNGAWHVVTYVTFRPGPGVSFIWHP